MGATGAGEKAARASSPDILAKSTGVTLHEHTCHLLEQWEKYIRPAHTYAETKYSGLTGTEPGALAARVWQAICWHDEGKKQPKWQSACQADHQEWKRWADGGRKGPRPRGRHLRDAGVRHEMESLRRLRARKPDAPPEVQAAIAAHHGKLGERHRKRWREDLGGAYRDLWVWLQRVSNDIQSDVATDFARALLQRYAYAGPRAMLQLADHRASAAEALADGEDNFLPGFFPFSYNFPGGWTPRGVQKKIEELRDEPLALLRAPTGSGKTDAALLWAECQIKTKRRADRLVIAMPTRFTANAIDITTPETLSVGLHHSSAWYQLRDRPPAEARAYAEMARLLETPITVTTLDHLCLCLTGGREDHHATFFNLAHACVVIDEVDFYDPFTQANLVVLLRALAVLKVPVLLMSATLPEAARALYAVPRPAAGQAEAAPVSVPPLYEDDEHAHRPRCHLRPVPRPIVEPEDLRPLLWRAIRDAEPTIVYVNTVQRAQRLYNWLIEEQGADPETTILYHSRFTEPDKKSIEERLTNQLGRTAWERGEARGIAVLTQIGELSVNISANRMISELCPLDRLVQRIGRLSRFPYPDTDIYPVGRLYLVLPHRVEDDGASRLYPAPYGTYQKGTGWLPAPALLQTQERLLRGTYTAAQLTHMVDELYATLDPAPRDAVRNADRLGEMIAQNWLVLPARESDDDEGATKAGEPWRCRDIDPQLTVLVGQDAALSSAHFIDDTEDDLDGDICWLPSWARWREMRLEFGISCYTHEVISAQEQGLVRKVNYRIGADAAQYETEEAWVALRGIYDPKRGLRLRDAG